MNDVDAPQPWMIDRIGELHDKHLDQDRRLRSLEDDMAPVLELQKAVVDNLQQALDKVLLQQQTQDFNASLGAPVQEATGEEIWNMQHELTNQKRVKKEMNRLLVEASHLKTRMSFWKNQASLFESMIRNADTIPGLEERWQGLEVQSNDFETAVQKLEDRQQMVDRWVMASMSEETPEQSPELASPATASSSASTTTTITPALGIQPVETSLGRKPHQTHDEWEQERLSSLSNADKAEIKAMCGGHNPAEMELAEYDKSINSVPLGNLSSNRISVTRRDSASFIATNQKLILMTPDQTNDRIFTKDEIDAKGPIKIQTAKLAGEREGLKRSASEREDGNKRIRR
jgi:hypothetical protein